MSPDLLFDWSGTLALAGWAILILGPRGWRWLDAVPMLAIPAVLSALYAVLVLTSFAGTGAASAALPRFGRSSPTTMCFWPDGSTTWPSTSS